MINRSCDFIVLNHGYDAVTSVCTFAVVDSCDEGLLGINCVVHVQAYDCRESPPCNSAGNLSVYVYLVHRGGTFTGIANVETLWPRWDTTR